MIEKLKDMEIPPALEEDCPKGMPKEIFLLGNRWEVKYASNLCDVHGLLGKTYALKRLILIDTSQCRDSMIDTLFHESMHAILSMSGMADLEDEFEEKIIRTLSPGMVSIGKVCHTWFKEE